MDLGAWDNGMVLGIEPPSQEWGLSPPLALTTASGGELLPPIAAVAPATWGTRDQSHMAWCGGVLGVWLRPLATGQPPKLSTRRRGNF